MKSYKQCCSEVAVKHKLGKSLVAGHLTKYWEEAAEMFAEQFKMDIPTYIEIGREAKKYGTTITGEPSTWHEIDFENGATWYRQEIERRKDNGV